jgi:hypothetical protein
MKRHLVTFVSALIVLVVVLGAFAQREGRSGPRAAGERQGGGMFQMLSPEEAAKMRERWQNMSEEEREKFRAQMRERWQNMSEEEREKLRAGMRERFGSGRVRLGREEQLKAIEDIQKQLAQLKTAIESFNPEDMRGLRDLSEEERTKVREKMTKAREERQKATEAIIAQIARLQGQTQPTAEGDRFIILNVGELRPIQEMAVKEKATETAQRLERLLTRGQRGFGGRPRRATTGAERSPGSGRGPGTTRERRGRGTGAEER